jgi:hypothetical protein
MALSVVTKCFGYVIHVIPKSKLFKLNSTQLNSTQLNSTQLNVRVLS